MKRMTNLKFAQQLCPEGVWGPRLHDKSEAKCVGPSFSRFFTIVLRNLDPQAPFRTQSLHNLCILFFRNVPVDGLLQFERAPLSVVDFLSGCSARSELPK